MVERQDFPGLEDAEGVNERRVEVVRACLPARVASVPEARQLLRTAAASAFPEVDMEVAALLVTELVGNSIVHAGTPVEMVVSALDGSIEVEVFDQSSLPPVPSARVLPGTGAGLRLLEELSHSWGTRGTATGKAVWFRLLAASQDSWETHGRGEIETTSEFSFRDRAMGNAGEKGDTA